MARTASRALAARLTVSRRRTVSAVVCSSWPVSTAPPGRHRPEPTRGIRARSNPRPPLRPGRPGRDTPALWPRRQDAHHRREEGLARLVSSLERLRVFGVDIDEHGIGVIDDVGSLVRGQAVVQRHHGRTELRVRVHRAHDAWRVQAAPHETLPGLEAELEEDARQGGWPDGSAPHRSRWPLRRDDRR
jgi:hypothetical protein